MAYEPSRTAAWEEQREERGSGATSAVGSEHGHADRSAAPASASPSSVSAATISAARAPEPSTRTAPTRSCAPPSTRASRSSTPPTSTARSSDSASGCWGWHCAARRDEAVVATKFGHVDYQPAVDGPAARIARLHPDRHRAVARAPRHRPHRPLPAAHPRPRDADRGDARRARRARARGQGAGDRALELQR